MKRTRVGKSFRRKVKKVLKSFAETKEVFKSTSYNCNSAIGSGDIISILPVIARGDNANQRIGKEIRPKSLIVDVHISYRSATIGFEAAEVIQSRLFIGVDKRVKTLQDAASIDTSFLRTDGSTQLTYDGSLVRDMLPKDKEFFTWYKDARHVFIKPLGYLNSSGGVDIVAQSDPNRSQHVRYKFVIPCPSVLKYEDNIDSSYPQNWYPFICVGYCYPQDLPADTLSEKLRVTFNVRMKYTDV